MAREHDDTLKIEKTKEARAKGISKMISEGGLGAENYYEIEKDRTNERVEDLDKKN